VPSFDEPEMTRWHVEFEPDEPEGHAIFPTGIGLSMDETDALRRASRNASNSRLTTSTMTIRGISHLTFVVRDLDRTAGLLTEGLGAKEVYDSAGRNFSLSREKFFLLGGTWLAFMEGEPSGRSYRHVAFEVAEEDLPAFERRLSSLSVEIRPPRPRVEGEGRSLYFYDYDDNLFELHTGTLAQRLERYSA
jgi:fosfomycin resistance protein FosX